MAFNSSDLVKRYTPPTCILEIYQKVFLIPLPNFSVESSNMMFQLHFDDPRLPQEDKITIKGDSSLFKILTEEVNNYISEYLHKKTLIQLTKKSQENLFPFNSTETINISLIENGLCHHQLYYSPDAKIINLTNTQLFDLANTLEKYQQESATIYQKQINRYWKRISLVSGLLVLTSLIGGFLWWRNQEIITSQKNEINQPIELNSDNIKPNVENVIPPSPLDPETIPSIISPTETEAMKNSPTLPPPPATLTQPPIPENNGNLINSPNSLPIPPNNNQTTAPINITPNNILPPPPSPPIPPPPSLAEMPDGKDNVIAINPNPKPISKPSLPKPAPINNPTPSFVNNNHQSPPRLSSLPVLESANSLSQPNNTQKVENSTNSVAINPTPNLIPNQTTTKIQNSSTPISEEIKQYFQQKWQPPDNLTQSIEYRLLINENGSLIRITPLGQTSQVFLDRTGMPLLGETISTPSPSVTVRLILSPNGDVKTFQE